MIFRCIMKNIQKYLKQMVGKPSTNQIVKICKQYYKEKIEDRKTKNFNPNNMLNMLNILLAKSTLPGRAKLTAKKQIKNLIFDIRIQNSQRTKMAPIFHPKKLLKLIEKVWYHNKNRNTKLLLAKRQAAVQAMICLMTGRRWKDITRLKWDTLQHVITQDDQFIKFLLPVSKTNQIGNRIETITLRKSKTKQFLCPVEMVKKLHYWVGQPTNGFVFKCLAPKTKWVDDEINKDWSSYRCKGHWNNEIKYPCLGQTSSIHSFGYIQRYAEKLGWKTLPTKHTFRRTCLIIAKQLGISRAQINEGFGWVPNSDMIRHYTADHDSTTLNAPAVAIAYELDQNIPFFCVQNVIFANP